MKLEEFSVTGIYCMIICVLWSEANDTICKREYTITDQITFTVDKACEWTVNASDSSAILLFTAQRQGNNVQLCDTGDIIKLTEDIGGDEVATLLQIDCSIPYATERVFSSTAKVKVTARGTAAVVNMTFTEYKKQQFTTSHEDTTWLDAQVGCEVEGGTTRTKCYCLDDSPGVLSLERDCTYPCPGSLGELCGGPNTITLYSLELCGQTYVDYYGSFSFTKSEKRDVYTSKSLIHIDTTADVSKSPKHIDTTADVRKSTIFINSTEDAGEDEQDEQSDENKIALYVPVTITSCVIVAAAIFVTICLRQKRAKKNPKRKVNENIYSYTTTEIQAQNSTPSDPKCELGEYIEVHNQSPRSAAYVIPMDQDASNQEYNTLHQRLEPTYSHPQENVYNETKKPSSVYGQYDISTVSTFTKNSSNKSQAMTDNVYNTCISRDGPCGDYDSQYDVSSASAFNKSSGKSKGQTDNVYNTFQTPDDTEYSETTFHTKEKETLPTDNEYASLASTAGGLWEYSADLCLGTDSVLLSLVLRMSPSDTTRIRPPSWTDDTEDALLAEMVRLSSSLYVSPRHVSPTMETRFTHRFSHWENKAI
ncbi:hypothetical protein MAR_011476, partial [Mya arenaria]